VWAVDDLIERIRYERKLRGWSIRAAAQAGGISNQGWSTFERTGRVTDGVQRAVMQAFDWPETWQEAPPERPVAPVGETAALRADLNDLKDQLREALEVMAELTAELRRQRDAGGAHPAPTAQPRRRASAQ